MIPVYNWQNSNGGNGGLLSRPDIRRQGYDPFDPSQTVDSSVAGSSRSLNENPMSVTNQNHSTAVDNWEERLLDDDDAVYRPSVYQPEQVVSPGSVAGVKQFGVGRCFVPCLKSYTVESGR